MHMKLSFKLNYESSNILLLEQCVHQDNVWEECEHLKGNTVIVLDCKAPWTQSLPSAIS